MQNAGLLLTVISVIWIIVLLVYFRWFTNLGIMARICFGLLLGGTIGNLIDRLRLGYVTDFIDVKIWGDFHWPIFNVADSSLSIGAILLAIYFLLNYQTLEISHKNKKYERTHSS